MRIETFLDGLAREAIATQLGVAAPAVVRSTQDAQLADYQVNGVLPLGKTLKRNPRELARLVARALSAHEAIAKAEVAGPGFVNLTLRDEWLAGQIRCSLADVTRDGVPTAERCEKIVVDFSAPNIAKQMHVGHLRSTIIGDAVVRLLRYQGHDVIGDNHLGDWGTQFGLLIAGMRRFGSGEALAAHPVEELERVYKLASTAAKEDDAVATEARAELVKLQAGDPENAALWRRFVAATRVTLDAVYADLGVVFDEWLGESAYHDMLPGVVRELIARGIAREDQGAVCVFFADREDAPDELRKLEEPFIVRKQDGAFLYSTTDIATLLYRRDRLQAERAVYVVDARQSLHFKQLFAVARWLGVDMRMDHVAFGAVLGTDGRPLKAREGTPLTLASLLGEARERAVSRIREEGLDVDAAQIDAVSRAVGIGAVKYADLRQHRVSDYQFNWEKMISFKGNAGPYLQYAHARVRSIFRKGDVVDVVRDAQVALVEPAERALARQLIRFPDTVHQAADGYLPHLVCDHLYELARRFSAFYESCPVLKAELAQRESRLALCSLTARQLARGLGLLGIATVERM